jgi:hypothetical protein
MTLSHDRRGGVRPLLPPPRWARVGLLLPLLLPLMAGPAAAQAPASGDRELAVHVFPLAHQPASEARAVVEPLLSARGSAELRQFDNTLVLRDTPTALARILPVLVAFDHPPRDVNVEIWLIRASGGAKVSPPLLGPSNLPRELLASLHNHFPYQQYDLVSASRVRSREAQRISFRLGHQHTVRFQLGTILGGKRLRLLGFEVFQAGHGEAPESLVKSELNLWLDRPMVFALSQGSPSALMVMVRVRQAAPAAGRRK